VPIAISGARDHSHNRTPLQPPTQTFADLDLFVTVAGTGLVRSNAAQHRAPVAPDNARFDRLGTQQGRFPGRIGRDWQHNGIRLIRATGRPVGSAPVRPACAGCHLSGAQGRQSPRAGCLTPTPPATAWARTWCRLTQGTQKETSQGRMFMHKFTGGDADAELTALANYISRQFGLHPGSITPN
jgi:hypothetical protein